VNLYTSEYYELTKRALKPGGIVSQWIPLHSQSEANVYQNFRTFIESFPYAMAWYPVKNELILIGSNQPINIDFQSIEQSLQDPVIQKIMSDIDFGTPYSFLGSIWYLKNQLKRLSLGQRIISDNNPSLEFFLGDPRRLSEDGIDRIIESRSSFEDTFETISQSSYFPSEAQKDILKKHWDSRLNEEYAGRKFILGLQSPNLDEAISHYKRAIELRPDYIQAHNNLGGALLNKGNTSEAISHYKKAIELQPDYFQAHNNLGNALLNKGNTSEAISHYKRAIELRPDYADAHYNLGNALLKKGNLAEAISHYKTSIEIKPNDAEAHNNLGGALLNIGNTSEAISHYKKAIELKPDYADANDNLKIAQSK
jgi:tetratricopeptide (TPR) repeat protein